jgi:AmmeMemoRadiSam system protein B
MPAVAGMFYPDDPESCRAEAQAYLQGASGQSNESRRWMGGIVPHAGWICSAAIAAETIAALARQAAPDVVVIFGAIHTPIRTELAALDTHQAWWVPGGEMELASESGRKLLESPDLFAADERFHRHEHAVEVELPLIQLAWKQATILPIEVPAREQAVAIGQATARNLNAAGLNVVYLASSDLTHYGPNYGFVPAGVGIGGLQWALDNDRRLLDLVKNFSVEAIVPHVRENLNACGAGAIAAMLAACREAGASAVEVLRHANSFQTLAESAPQPPTNAVGYASVVVG